MLFLESKRPICDAVHAVMSKKHPKSSTTAQEEGLANEDRDHLLLMNKQPHDKRSIAESLPAYVNRVRSTVCEVGVFLKEILGECRTLWGEREQAKHCGIELWHNCYVPKALPVKYETTAHRLCMAYS